MVRTLPLTAGALALALAATACQPPADQAASGDSGASGKPAQRQAAAAGIGQPAKDGKLTFRVTKLATRTTRIGDQYVGADPQGKFVLVSLSVTNHAKEAQTFMGSAQKLLAGGKEYSASDEAAVWLESSKSLYEQINPGNSVKGVVVFDVPRDVKPSVLELHDSPFSGGVRVNVR
ncbi:DUF4352 domain-containing protein [Actinomadura hibisca]|uniref:DUF4352 domain-containing protein n=1 Tax=Actinomadura hibisca TaxID=68565 RepID=UPI00082C8FFA|nr:DUF4352 domain-containing protein [Actinomadura hibisca]